MTHVHIKWKSVVAAVVLLLLILIILYYGKYPKLWFLHFVCKGFVKVNIADAAIWL
jgi:hypothetical protein